MNKKKVVKDDFINQEIDLTPVSQIITDSSDKISLAEKKPDNNILSSNKKLGNSFFKVPYFNLDIILSAIAFGCILGVILFYFQGLQPLILRNYSENASKKVVQLKEKYTSQIGPVILAKQNLSVAFENDADKICSEQNLYEGKLADQEKNDRLKLSLVPDSTLKNIDNSGPFYNSEIQQVYQKFFNQYVEALSTWSKGVSNLNELPNFLEYRNLWIITCQKIESSNADLALLKEACTNFNNGLVKYESLKNSQFWEQIAKGVEESAVKCNEVINSTSRLKTFGNFGKWKLDWLNGFDRVLAVRPIWNEVNEDLNKVSEDLLNGASATIVKLNLIAEERQQFINLWYIMEFKAP
jgi:hypothetical protein